MAGLTYGALDVAGVSAAPSATATLMDTVNRHLMRTATQTGISTGLSIAKGTPAKKALKQGLKNVAATVIQAVAANQIGASYAQGQIDTLTHTVYHALFGALAGQLTSGDPLAGAIGSVAAETVAEIVSGAFPGSLTPETCADIGRAAAAAATTVVLAAAPNLMTKNSVGTAIATANTAVENNYLAHLARAVPAAAAAAAEAGTAAKVAWEIYSLAYADELEATKQEVCETVAQKVGCDPSTVETIYDGLMLAGSTARTIRSGAKTLYHKLTGKVAQEAATPIVGKGKEKVDPFVDADKGKTKVEQSNAQLSVKPNNTPHETPNRLELGNRSTTSSSSYQDVDSFTYGTIRNSTAHPRATKPVIITSTTTTTSTTSVCTITTTSTTTTTVAPALVQPQGQAIISSNFSKLTKQYVRDMETRSGIKITDQQRLTLKNELQSKKFEKLLPERYVEHKKIYDNPKTKTQIISDWEKNTGQKWPTTTKLVDDGKGNLISKPIREEIHHIIPQQHGGPHEWWNAHPLSRAQHQGGIHGSGSPLNQVIREMKK
jgi:hypothetical protein